MEKKIYNLVKALGKFDGKFFWKSTNSPIKVGTKNVSRILVGANNKVQVELMGDDNDCRILDFSGLAERYRYTIYCDLFRRCEPMTLAAFLGSVCVNMQAGDTMDVHTQENDGDTYRMFVIRNADKKVICEFNEKFEIYYTDGKD